MQEDRLASVSTARCRRRRHRRRPLIRSDLRPIRSLASSLVVHDLITAIFRRLLSLDLDAQV